MSTRNEAIDRASQVLGGQAELARAIGVTPGAVNQWGKGIRPVPDDRGVLIEQVTNFEVPVDDLCPDTRWHRVPDPAWPNGKPLIDKTPVTATEPAAAPAQQGA